MPLNPTTAPAAERVLSAEEHEEVMRLHIYNGMLIGDAIGRVMGWDRPWIVKEQRS